MPSPKVVRPIQKVWTHCPRCGAPAVKKGLNPFRCASCSYTHYFSPCTAVGAITADPEGRILLLVRGKDPGKGLFGLPGGFVDVGETAEEALHREVQEEIGLTVVGQQYLASFPNQYIYDGAILPVTDLFFVMHVESFDKIELLDGEITDWHFCHPTSRELKKMAFESNRRALKLYLAQQNRAQKKTKSKS